MRVALPGVVRVLPLGRPVAAVRVYAALLRDLRGGGAAGDLEAVAIEAVETALREHAVLLAVVTPPGAAPAVLTGTVLTVPRPWDADTAETLRDALEDRGARDTIVLPRRHGPAILAQRGRRLQAFLPAPGGGRLLLLTLAASATLGWVAHQAVLAAIATDPADDADDSFEHHTFRLCGPG